MKTFRWGIMGTGGIAQSLAADLAYLPDHRVAAIGSRTIESANTFGELFPDAERYGSYEELVRADVDAIYIATPHTFHYENMKLALNAGKHVLCEKAFTINAEQAREVIDLARSKDLALQEAMWTRFLPHIRRVREIISAGTLGEIHTVIADHGQKLTPNPNPRLWSPELGGGALLDVGIYPIALAHMIFGRPETISAAATFSDLGVDLQTSMIFTYANGAHASLTSSFLSRTPNTASIVGDKARIDIDGIFYCPSSFTVIATDDSVIERYENNYVGGGLREEAATFATNINAGRLESSELPLNESLEIMEVMDEIRSIIGMRFPEEC